MSPDLTQVVARMLKSLRRKELAHVLIPMLIKEAMLYALVGPQGCQLSAFASADRHHQRIANVIRYIHLHYKEPLEINDLASQANMSVSSLHHHFKAVTNSSPLQYIKAMRLHQAHQLVTLEAQSVSEAAFKVGYQSLSQFSREYKRLFGQAPSQAMP